MDDAPSGDVAGDMAGDMDAAARRLFDRLAEVAAKLEAERTRHEAVTRPLIEERNRLWHDLTARGYSRRDLATVAKVTPMTVQAVIKGRPSRERNRERRWKGARPSRHPGNGSGSDAGSGADAKP